MANKVQNAIMAKRMKDLGIVRKTQQCVICNKQVALANYGNHIETHN